MESWCGNCAKDKEWSEGKPFDDCAEDEICRIIGDTMAYSVNDPNYPKAWVYSQSGRPMCLAFEQKGKPYRCPRTVDMFSGQTG